MSKCTDQSKHLEILGCAAQSLKMASMIEVAVAVQAGLVERNNSLRIVRMRSQMAMVGVIQQGLSEKEEMDSLWQLNELRKSQGLESEWTHAQSQAWWRLEKNLTYMVEFGEDIVAETGALRDLERPLSSASCLKRYNAIGLKLRFLTVNEMLANYRAP